MVTLGVTGGLGSGKSTACQRFSERGAILFDADSVAKDLLQSNRELQEKITAEFGQDLVRDGSVDTAKLARIAFAGEETQTALNNIVHPYVIGEFEAVRTPRESVEGLLVVDAPLIFESGFDNRLDHTLLIYTTYRLRLQRALRRGTLSRDQLLRRIALQMPEEEKRELASFVIENNGTIEQLHQRVDRLYEQLVG